MPKLSVWMVRASMIYMGIGFLFGSLILHHKGVPIFDWTWKLLNPHITLMIFGWTMQFVMGIAFFILPRFSHREHRYGVEYLGWMSFYLFNTGILCSVFAGWFAHYSFTLIGTLFLLAGVIIYVVMIWSRVKPVAIGQPTKRPQVNN